MLSETQKNYISQPAKQYSESSFIRLNKMFLQNFNENKSINDFTYDRNHQNNKTNIFSTDNSYKFKRKSDNQDSQDKFVDNSFNQVDYISTLKNCNSQLISKYPSLKNSTFKNYNSNEQTQINQQTQFFFKRSLQKSKNLNKSQSKNQIYKVICNQNVNCKVPTYQKPYYKKLLQAQIQKRYKLQRKIYSLQKQVSNQHILAQSLSSKIKTLNRQLCSQSRKSQSKQTINTLDKKLNNLKTQYEECFISKQAKQCIDELKKQNKILKQDIKKYQSFVDTLGQSIFILKGKRPKDLTQLWAQYSELFEFISQNKWKQNKTIKIKHNKMFSK